MTAVPTETAGRVLVLQPMWNSEETEDMVAQ